MATLKLVVACIAIFTLAFFLQFKHVQADRAQITEQLSGVDTVQLWDDSTRLNITCSAASSDGSIEKIYFTSHISTVHIVHCGPPRLSYVQLLSALDVNVAEVQELSLLGVPGEGVGDLQARHFDELPITILNIYGARSSRPLKPEYDFLGPLKNLRYLTVVHAELPPLPQHTNPEVVNLRRGSSVGGFGNCAYLKFLTLEEWEVPEPSGPWLAHCPELSSVRLVGLTSDMPARVLSGANRLFNLALINCSVSELTKQLLSPVTGPLSQLHLSHNKIHSIAHDAFESQNALKELNLEHNELKGAALAAVRALRALRVLALSYNPMEDICEQFQGKLNISDLSMSNCGIPRLCFRDWTSLVLFNLTNNNITTLEFDQLPMVMSRGRALEVSLRGNPITRVHFPESLYHQLSELRQKTGEPPMAESPRGVEPFARITADITLDCACEHLWLQRAIHKDLIQVRSIRCAGDTRTSLASHRLNCHQSGSDDDRVPSRADDSARPAGDSFDCGGCQCHRRGDAVKANCARGAVHAMPRVKGLAELYAANNHIEKLEADDLPDSLSVLDIRNNGVSRLDAAAARALFAVPGRRTRLAGNPIACDCANVPLLTYLHNNNEQIEDYEYLNCATGLAVSHVVLDSLCDNSQSTDGSENPTKDGAQATALASVVPLAFALITALVI